MTLSRLAASTLRMEPPYSPAERQARRQAPRSARRRVRVLAVHLILAGHLLAALAWPAAALSPAEPSAAEGTPEHAAPQATVLGVVRLHVVAHSDRPEDQALKLAVRDAVLARYGNELVSLSDEASVAAWIASHRDRVQALATRVLVDGGASYGARLVLGWEHFPESRFGPLVFRAGRYHTLRLILGDGAGKNWWCVLFPPLCVVDDGQVTDVEVRPADLAVPALNPLGSGSSEAPGRPVEWRWSFLEQEDGTPLHLARWWSEAQRLVARGTARLLGQPARAGAPEEAAPGADAPASE